MCLAVASQSTSIRRPIVGDRLSPVRRNHLDIKVDQPLAGDVRVRASQTMSRVTYRARDALVDMVGVLLKTCIGNDLIQIVALRTERLGPVAGEVWIGK
jgi:hypothetical protein